MTTEQVTIEPLDEGCIVHVFDSDWPDARRIAAVSRQEALTIAARALGYRGVIRFDDEPRTVEVPVAGVIANGLGMTRAEFAADLARAMCPHIVPPQAYGLGPGPAVDDDEPPLRAGTAAGDKL